MWKRPEVEGLQTQNLAWEPVPPDALGGAGGGLRRVLSRDASDGAITTVQRFTDRQHGVLASALDAFVLSGGGTLNGHPLQPGSYLHVPSDGPALDLQPAPCGLVLYCGYWGPPTLLAEGDGDQQVRVVDTTLLRWDMPEWSGDTDLEPGVGVKWLRRGTGAIVYLAAMLPGWKCPLEEAHPVYEESFKLTGSILMGSRGVNRAGSYFFRSPDVFHGPLYSADGTMSLIRSDAPTTTEYREPTEGRDWQALAAEAYGSRGNPETFE